MLREFEITCPTCEGWILIDLESGEVLRHGAKGETREDAKPAGGTTFADLMDRVKGREERGDDTFSDAVKSVEDSKKKLEDAFEEAKKKAKERPDDKPSNPFNDLFTD